MKELLELSSMARAMKLFGRINAFLFSGLVVSLALTFFLWGSASPSETVLDIKLSDPKLDAAEVERQQADFSFDQSGSLTRGPIRAINDPIDYSSILKSDVLLGAFEASLFNCIEGIRYCHRDIYRLSDETFALKVNFETGHLEPIHFEKMIRVFENTLGAIGFNLRAESDSEKANLFVYVGSESFLTRHLENNSDAYGLAQISESANLNPICYVSTRNRDKLGVTAIYLTSDNLENCLPKSALISIGLNEISGEVPSVLNIDSTYRGATFADYLFVKMLYDKKLNIQKDLLSVRKIWHNNVNRIRSGSN